MLLTSVIIVLREFLEAALLISVLLALGDSIHVHRRWAGWCIGIGLLGAVVYASNTATVSDWLDGAGQEVVNALMQVAIYCCLTLIALIYSRRQGRPMTDDKSLVFLMVASISLAITREGSEILIYLSAFSGDPTLFQPILLGGLVGAGIGISVGALAYFLLSNNNRSWSPYAIIGVITLVAAGMISQAASLLIQADWLPAQLPLWDTTTWVSESSVTGQLLYALIGYEATPTPLEVAVHVGGLLLPLLLILIFRPGARENV